MLVLQELAAQADIEYALGSLDTCKAALKAEKARVIQLEQDLHQSQVAAAEAKTEVKHFVAAGFTSHCSV